MIPPISRITVENYVIARTDSFLGAVPVLALQTAIGVVVSKDSCTVPIFQNVNTDRRLSIIKVIDVLFRGVREGGIVIHKRFSLGGGYGEQCCGQ